MTWIIGRGGPFGHAVGISDIRITLPDRSTHDCLRKLYKLGPQLVLGFAGSVQIGLEMVSQLAAILGADDDRGIWDPLESPTVSPSERRPSFTLSRRSFERKDAN